jgi:hypothetical protein
MCRQHSPHDERQHADLAVGADAVEDVEQLADHPGLGFGVVMLRHSISSGSPSI